MDEMEKLVKTSVYLEDEMLGALGELQKEYSEQTGRRWSMGAVIRLALSEFFSKRGLMV